MIKKIEDEKIYYVGFSDGQSDDKTHYMCMYDESEEVTKNWCNEVNKKYGECTVMLKLNGKTLNKYREIVINEIKEILKKHR